MGEEDHRPREDRGEGGDRGDEEEEPVLDGEEEGDADRAGDEHAQDRDDRDVAVAGEAVEGRWGVPLLGEPVHGARAGVEDRIHRGECGRDDDEVHDVLGRRDLERGEDLDEGGGLAGDLGPRVDRHDDGERRDVEEEDAEGHGVDRAGDRPVRVVGLAGGHAERLDAAEGEDDDAEAHDDAPEAEGREAVVLPQVGEVRGRATDLPAPDDEHEATDDEGEDREDLDEGEPELHLAEDPHGHEVEATDEGDGGDHPHPARHVGEPQPHVRGDGRHVGDRHDGELEPEDPAGDESRPRAEEGPGVLGEGSGDGVPHRHLAEGAHDDEDHDAGDEVGEEHRRAGGLDGLGGAEEEARPDRRPQRDELDVARVEPAGELVGGGRGSRIHPHTLPQTTAEGEGSRPAGTKGVASRCSTVRS